MHPPSIAAFHVGLNALLLVGLAVVVVCTRGRVGVALVGARGWAAQPIGMALTLGAMLLSALGLAGHALAEGL